MRQKPFVSVVDDDPSVCKALRRLLQAANMEVETFLSGDLFLGARLKREPDCLVLDVRMPGMSGPELQKRLHANRRFIPVVFITAHAEAEDEDAATRGETEILHKPFDDQALLDAIERAVSRDNG